MSFPTMRIFMAVLLGLAFVNTTVAEKPTKKKDPGADKVQTRTVTASVQHVVGQGTGVDAGRKPTTFKIGKGQTAYDFRYSFDDHRQNVHIKHKGPGNIYSVTKRKYVSTASPNPDFTLGEGEYKFFVGGMPGASGSMSFKIKDIAKKEETKEQKELAKNADRIIETITWIADRPDEKTEATFYVRGTKVIGVIDQIAEGIKHEHVTSEKPRHKGSFTGTIKGDVIKGTWKFKILPHRVVVHGTDGKDIGRKDWSSMTIDSVTTLKKGGTLTETMKVAGTSNTQWDAGAPGELSGKLQSHDFTTTVPGEYVKQPMQGTWKDRK